MTIYQLVMNLRKINKRNNKRNNERNNERNKQALHLLSEVAGLARLNLT